MKINFPKQPSRQPTKRELKNYNKWLRYLKDSRLTESEVYSRAASLAQTENFDSYIRKNYK